MWEATLYLLATLLLATLVHLVLSRCFKGGGPLYWWRWAGLVLEVWLERASRQPWINMYDVTGGSAYELCGMEATPFEKELERPKPLTTDRHGDGVMLCGVDRDGRAVVARIVRLTQRRASVFLFVIDHTGAVYTLPNQPDTNEVNVSGEGWHGAGLTLTCIDPMRSWSLKFNGLLRRGATDQCATDEVFHARLDLLWRAMHCPVDFWEEVSPRLLAHALARDPSASLQAFLCEVGEGYDQWGALHGEVSLLPGSQPQVWYLRGPRQHRWGLNTAPDRALASFLYFNNGDVCSLHGHSSSTTQYVAGYVQGAGGALRPVTWTDLSLQRREGQLNIGNNLLIKLTGGGRTYEIWQQLGPGLTFYSGDPWSQRHSLHRSTAAATHSYGWGITIFSDRYSDLCPVPERRSLPVVEVPRVALAQEEVPLVLTLDDPLCRNPDLTGGKGSSVALLAAYRRLLPSDQEQYEVPRGLVLTTAAWLLQLRSSSDLQQAVKAVRQAVRAVQQVDGAVQQAVGATHLFQLKDACSRAVEVCQRVPVCAAVTEALHEALQLMGPDDCRLAVRSSGCGEDGQETCAAGQNQTVLGVRGHAHLLQALTRCWASNFSFQSVEYRRQHGQEVEVGMGVVVQEMVQEAAAAGVMFSLDPVTGSPANITITANYGLGESVVSAAAEPDTVVVRRSWRDHLTIASTTLGAKMTKCVMQAEEGGTMEVEVAPEDRGRQCLSDAMALRLARLAIFLEKAFAGPRDVEFAVSQEQVYLLQARPITSLHAWTDYEIIHEQDSALFTDHEIITNANTGEVFPGRTTPLTLSTVLPALDLALQWSTKYDHWPNRKKYYHNMCCTTYYSHVFLNILEISYWNKEGVTLMNRALDLELHGREVTTPQFVEWGVERMAEHSNLHWFLALALDLYNKLTVPGMVRRSRNQFGHYRLDTDRADSAASLYSEITRRLPHLQQVSRTHMNTSRLSSTTQTIAFLILANGKQEFSEENKSDIAILLASSGAESADVPTTLKAVSQLLAESEDVEEFLAMTPDEGHVWLQSHPGHVGHAFRDFLLKHGHRCIKEFDLGSLSWGLDPRSLVHTLQVMVRQPGGGSTSGRNHLTVQQALDALHSPVSHNTKRSLGFILPMCREAVEHREASKSIVIKVVDGFRRAYRKLGELMVCEGRLPSPDLVFYLKHAELGHLLDASSPSLLTKAVHRRRLHSRLDQLKFPGISIGLPKPILAGEESGAEDGARVEVLRGTPVCHGLVTAPVRVINNIEDAPIIQSGDVLVTFSTDVGWTPYFPILAGVITEIGGLVSHGAVVAREYGLPCVVGVAAATQILKSGEIIELNAMRGTITRLHLQPSDDPPLPHTNEDDENHDSDGGSSDNINRESAESSDSDNSLQNSDSEGTKQPEQPQDQA